MSGHLSLHFTSLPAFFVVDKCGYFGFFEGWSCAPWPLNPDEMVYSELDRLHLNTRLTELSWVWQFPRPWLLWPEEIPIRRKRDVLILNMGWINMLIANFTGETISPLNPANFNPVCKLKENLLHIKLFLRFLVHVWTSHSWIALVGQSSNWTTAYYFRVASENIRWVGTAIL